MKIQLKRTLKADFYLLFHSRVFWAILAVPVLILLDSPLDFLMHLKGEWDGGSVQYHYFHSINFGGLFGPYLIPMVCALPYAVSLCDERAASAFRYSLARGDRRSYFLSKYIVSVLSGGLTFMLGLGLLFVLLDIPFPLFTADDLSFYASGYFYRDIVLNTPWLYYVIAAFYGFLSGCIYAGFAAVVSTFTVSRSAVIASPFVLTFGMTQIHVLFKIPMHRRLFSWLAMEATYNCQVGSEGMTIILAVLRTILIIAVCGMIFYMNGRRVLRHE